MIQEMVPFIRDAWKAFEAAARQEREAYEASLIAFHGGAFRLTAEFHNRLSALVTVQEAERHPAVQAAIAARFGAGSAYKPAVLSVIKRIVRPGLAPEPDPAAEQTSQLVAAIERLRRTVEQQTRSVAV